MKISVIGCGYLGLTHAVSMASLGHEVIAIDTNKSTIDTLRKGIPTFHEARLPELMKRYSSLLHFTTDYAEARAAQVHFIGVGTPQRDDSGEADLSYVFSAFNSLLKNLDLTRPQVIVGKSTVVPGTCASLNRELANQSNIELVWNPEFLREGFAVEDTLRPSRIVYGTHNGKPSAGSALLDEVYEDILNHEVPKIVTNYETAELIKLAANAFLATKISYANALSHLCENVGADIRSLTQAIGMDERINPHFLGAGSGYGGGCLPKDLRASAWLFGKYNLAGPAAMLGAVDTINRESMTRVVEKIMSATSPRTGSLRVAVLGAAFKPNSDDVRQSPALSLAGELLSRGAQVHITDPQALDNARKILPQAQFADSAAQACLNADVVAVGTQWREYRDLNPNDLAPAQRIIVDTRNCLAPNKWRRAGWRYIGVGIA